MTNIKNQIQLRNINYRINEKLFFKNLSIKFSIRGITVILGPNGSGKSLLTKIIKGLIKPDSGDIIVRLKGRYPRIGYLSQNMTFLRRDVFSNLSYPMEIKGDQPKYIKKKISSLLQYFEFMGKENSSARNLSLGNKQYLSFIRTLVNNPNFLILDEPSSHLDMKSTKKIEKYLLKKKQDLKIIMVTHDLFQAKRLADEILFMKEGELIDISSKRIFLKSQNRLIKKFLAGNLI